MSQGRQVLLHPAAGRSRHQLLYLGLMSLLVSLAACTQPPRSEVATICDSEGCRVQDRTLASVAPERPGKSEAQRALEARAEDDPAAAFDLAMRLFRGDGAVAQDTRAAFQWMRRAGERGHVRAQLALGRFYMSGLEEMGPDPREAEKWLTLAAAQGDDDAERLLEELRPSLEARRARDAARHRRRLEARHGWHYAPVYPYHGHADGRALIRY